MSTPRVIRDKTNRKFVVVKTVGSRNIMGGNRSKHPGLKPEIQGKMRKNLIYLTGRQTTVKIGMGRGRRNR